MPVTNRRLRLLSATKGSIETPTTSNETKDLVLANDDQETSAKEETAGDEAHDFCDGAIIEKDDTDSTSTTATERPLTEDIFSLIYIGNFYSSSFHFAVFIFLFQLSATILIILDLIDSTSESNHLRVPVSCKPDIIDSLFNQGMMSFISKH